MNNSNLSRRGFVKGLGISAVSWGAIPGVFNNKAHAAGSSLNERKIVVCFLDGGPDTLDYLLYDLPEAQARRPIIQGTAGRPSSGMITLGHPYLKLNGNFKKLYDSFGGNLALFSSVSQPNSSGSHDEARMHQYKAVPSGSVVSSSWLGRVVEELAKSDPSPFLAWGFSAGDSLALQSGGYRGIVANPNLAQYAMSRDGNVSAVENSAREYLIRSNLPAQNVFGGQLGLNLRSTTDGLHKSVLGVRDLNTQYGTRPVTYPNNGLASQLKAVATLISGGEGRVFACRANGGHDTHSEQIQRNNSSMLQNSDALTAFLQDMQISGQLDKVTVIVHGEFGRQIKENSTAGTDHGWGGVFFVMGGGVTGGVYGGVATPQQIATYYGLPRPDDKTNAGTHHYSVKYEAVKWMLKGNVPAGIFPSQWSDSTNFRCFSA